MQSAPSAFKLSALPKHWISVTAPVCASARVNPALWIRCVSIDSATLVGEIKRQAGEIAKGDVKAIRTLMSVQALVSHQVGLWTIHDAVTAITPEARSYVRRQGVSMLNAAQIMLERLARLDEVKPTTMVNIARRQTFVENPPTERKTRNLRNRLNGKNHKRLDAGTATEILPEPASAGTLEEKHRPTLPRW